MITAFIAGVCTGIGIVLWKMSSDIVEYNGFAESFEIKEFYIYFLSMLIFMGMQFKYLTNIIRLYSQLQAIPLFEICIIIGTLMASDFIKKEFKSYYI